jgi:hypothetical protein
VYITITNEQEKDHNIKNNVSWLQRKEYFGYACYNSRSNGNHCMAWWWKFCHHKLYKEATPSLVFILFVFISFESQGLVEAFPAVPTNVCDYNRSRQYF